MKIKQDKSILNAMVIVTMVFTFLNWLLLMSNAYHVGEIKESIKCECVEKVMK